MPHGRAPAALSASHAAAARTAGTWSTKPGPRTSLARCARTGTPPSVTTACA